MVDPAPTVIGHFSLTRDWRLQGWCWCPDRPDERLAVEISVNGAVVRRCTASEPNDQLRGAGLGDGQCGFALSVPAEVGTDADGETIVEAREVRSGVVLGRVIFHADAAARALDRTLDRLSTCTSAWFALLNAPDPRLQVIGGSFGRFGAALVDENRRRLLGTPVARKTALPVVSTDEAPALSLIVLDPCSADTLAGLRRHAHAALGCAIEALTPGVGGVNAAASMARAARLCLVDRADEFLAVGLERWINPKAPVRLGSGAAPRLRGLGVGVWTTGARPDGAAAILSRGDLHAAGGLGREPGGGIDWRGLAQTLAVLGRAIEVHEPRPAASALR